MANWSNPLLTSTYTNFLTEVKDRDTDLALQFDGTTSSNIPTGAIRWNSSVNRWQKWNGSSWGELTSTYALTGLSTTGNASIGGTLGSGAFTSSGTVTGTALLPTGSAVPANGIYLPSANTLGLATSTTCRVLVDSNGRVGIGTTSPSTGFHIENAPGSATIGNLYISNSGQARYHLYNGGGIAEWIFGQKTGGDHNFKLSKSVAGSESDYFPVDTAGNLSLPATGMRLRLGRILDADANDSTLTLFGGTNDGANIELFGGAHATFPNLAVIDANEHRFRTANGVTEYARVTSAGRLGLGTSSPGYLLHVNTASNVDVETATQNSTGLSRFGTRAGGNTFIGAFTASKGVEIWAASAQVAYFADTGRFGLGTSSPGSSFDVALPAASATVGNVRISPSSAGQARCHLYNGGGTAEWLFGQKTSTDHDFKLSTSVAGSETDRLAVTTGGLLKFDSGYGANQTIRGNGNVSSVYKNATGNYTVTFTTAMPDANYAVNVTVRQAGSGSNIKATVDNIQSNSCRVYCNDPATANLLDATVVCVTIFR